MDKNSNRLNFLSRSFWVWRLLYIWMQSKLLPIKFTLYFVLIWLIDFFLGGGMLCATRRVDFHRNILSERLHLLPWHTCVTLKEIFDPHLIVVGIFGRTQFKRPPSPQALWKLTTICDSQFLSEILAFYLFYCSDSSTYCLSS